jgi:tripartite-type tricarboxylate transporter receptor subunit TctC
MMKKVLTATLACLAMASAFGADDYPNKTIRIVVPFGAGNLTDAYARIAAQKISEELKQPVVVENKPGATSILGATTVAQSPADGYTLLFTASTHVIAQVTRKKPPFDAVKDFTPIGQAIQYPYYMIASTSLPAKNLPEFLTYAKARPGKLNYGTVGEGSGGHLLGVIFGQITGVQAVHVPYKATSGFLSGLQSGEVDFAFDSIGSAHSLVMANRLRGYALTSDKRMPATPQTPTMQEEGVPGFESWLWLGLMAPANTPQSVVQKLNKAMNAAFETPEMRARIEKDGLQLATGTPEKFGQRIQADLQVWGDAAKRAKVALD